MSSERVLATTLELQEDFPKGSKIEAWSVFVPTGQDVGYTEIELIPIRTEHVGVTEDKGADMSLPVALHIPEGCILVQTIPTYMDVHMAHKMSKQLSACVTHSRAAVGVQLPAESTLSTLALDDLRAVRQYLDAVIGEAENVSTVV